ncbi:DUF5994 family protein [Streptomyces sp. NPDC087218]|uniref:DUF5994 family protein n=1 Tax=Streptomyces sp. NPDC087218 TaxID=3365769 RepID=UPI0038272E4D
MTSTTDPTRQARLALTPKTSLAGLLDGAWWPYSRDLAAELPSLVDALEERWGRITRLTANPAPWPTVPYAVPVHGHTVHIGWFTEQARDRMILLSCSLGRCDLLVVPPEAGSASAARLMAAASAPGNVHDTEAVMSAESADGHASREGARAADREAHWPKRARPVVGARMLPLPRSMRR